MKKKRNWTRKNRDKTGDKRSVTKLLRMFLSEAINY